MLKTGSNLRFVAEVLAALPISSEARGQDLDDHQVVQDGVLGLVDRTHAAPADLLNYLVFGEGSTNLMRHRVTADHAGSPFVHADDLK